MEEMGVTEVTLYEPVTLNNLSQSCCAVIVFQESSVEVEPVEMASYPTDDNSAEAEEVCFWSNTDWQGPH